MPEERNDQRGANQIEILIRGLDSLMTLPSIGERILSGLSESPGAGGHLAETIECDPALAARFVSLRRRYGLGIDSGSMRSMVDKLPADVVRDALISAKVIEPFANGWGYDRTEVRSGLLRHSLAVGCCAEAIARVVDGSVDCRVAYFAGLLHDIGKLAVEQMMPKSFGRIAEEARSQHAAGWFVEQGHLGIDHTVIGKRLCQQWNLGEEIELAVWLHHIDGSVIAEKMPEAKIALIVQLADAVSRHVGIGDSGSYEPVGESVERLAGLLGVGGSPLEQIRQELAGKTEQKAKVLGLDIPNAAAAYCRTMQSSVVGMAGENSKLREENRRLKIGASHFEFVREFLSGVDSRSLVIDVAERFAAGWQKFYQTGKICLYLAPSVGLQRVEAVVVKTLGKSRAAYFDIPAGAAVVPPQIEGKFDILNAEEYADWLFSRLDEDFDLGATKLLPLLSRGRAVGALIFEVRYPGDVEEFREHFAAASSIGGCVLDMAAGSWGRERLAERFAGVLTWRPSRAAEAAVKAEEKAVEKAQDEAAGPIEAEVGPMEVLAEMAGGAAHELNGPLSVISGRAQLLAGGETDPEKKRILEQIYDNAGEIARVIEDLMEYAKPHEPRAGRTDVKLMLDETLEFALAKAKVDHINAQVEVAEDVGSVFVDSAQIVTAIANILCNSLESYREKAGPVKITAEKACLGEFVQVRVRDLGRGMAAETVRKATSPFFSLKDAGRKRGMGLAHARRLIELNGGRLEIASELGRGTTVTVMLPRQ